MDNKITLDRKTFKALASDTRIEILRKLEERQQTLSDLALEFDMAPSTIKEHLDKLVEANLIKIVDKGMKWKYYKLTRKGHKLLNPYETKVWIVLGTAILGLFVSLYKIILDLKKIIYIEGIQKGEIDSVKGVGEEALAPTAGITKELIATPPLPYLELLWVIILILIIGICVGYLIKKKKII